jgi:RNA polymerase sigma-70 factor (ECF subfamily)
LIWIERYLRHALREFEQHRNTYRHRQALNQASPIWQSSPNRSTDSGKSTTWTSVDATRLARVVHQYRRAADRLGRDSTGASGTQTDSQYRCAFAVSPSNAAIARPGRVLVDLLAVDGAGGTPDSDLTRRRTADQPAGAISRFDQLFSELLPRLYKRAVLLAGDGAEDAVHEVYLKLVRRPRRVLEHPQPYAYLIATLVSVVRDDWRRHRHWVSVADVPDQPEMVAPVDVYEARSQATWLLRQLSPGQAAAVLLVDLDGYTIDEAAAVLGVHRGTVSRARYRALAVLRDLLKDHRR